MTAPVRMTLTLASGAQVAFDTDEREAHDVRDAVRRSWAATDTASGDLAVGTGHVTDWIRMADISAVRIVPLPGAAVLEEPVQGGQENTP